MMRTGYYMVLLWVLWAPVANAQTAVLKGCVQNDSAAVPLANVEIFLVDRPKISCSTNARGRFVLKGIPEGKQTLQVYLKGYRTQTLVVGFEKNVTKNIAVVMPRLARRLKEVEISDTSGNGRDMDYMRPVEGMAIYNGIKNEVIVLEHALANISNNNSRQIFVKVPGLNIWESDGAGIQLGIGGRGLSPDRTSHFNVRQNLYDISADPLGYPESYYTPPMEAIERIEIVRGAASLQYGTQFGGLLNFRMKTGPKNKKAEVNSRQTVGSFGLRDTISGGLAAYHSFTSVGGTTGRLNYYTFHQYKKGSGWRPNTGYDVHTVHGNFRYTANDKLSFGLDLTWMNYLAQQGGGLTDVHFNSNPRQSFRERNWFAVDWKLGAFFVHYKLSSATEISSHTFGLLASRKALGFIGQAGRTDPLEERDLIWGEFKNKGNETRLIHRFNRGKHIVVFLAGIRYYQGFNHSRQGLADATDRPHFSFLNPDHLEDSDYVFPNTNASAFSQMIVPLSERWSLTPGIRFEHIHTRSDGIYRDDETGDGDALDTHTDRQMHKRRFVLGGLGASYKAPDGMEFYTNISQNYRAINFTDIQIQNGSLVIDPDIQDERGFNADMGIRGKWKKHLQYDVSTFMLHYNNRIGVANTAVPDPVLIRKIIQHRTNISDAVTVGIESFLETELLHFFAGDSFHSQVNWFVNTSLIHAQYTDSKEPAFDGKAVELVPPFTFRTGLNFRHKAFSAGMQFSHVASHFSDATNAESTTDGVDGRIPAYQVTDLSARYHQKHWSVAFSINNLTDAAYFTRRASGYPGPGIIPSDGRAYYLTLGVKW